MALLRGINVGGKNIIRMADLRSCFEAEGFRDVLTYIQSGNVIFRAPDSTPGALTIRIEEMLASAFDYQGKVVLALPPSRWRRWSPGRRRDSARNPIGIATTSSS